MFILKLSGGILAVGEIESISSIFQKGVKTSLKLIHNKWHASICVQVETVSSWNDLLFIKASLNHFLALVCLHLKIGLVLALVRKMDGVNVNQFKS